MWALLAYVRVRLHAKEGDPRAMQARGQTGVEIVWTVIPALVVVAIVVPQFALVAAYLLSLR